MRFDILTLFPEVFPPYLNVSMLQKAQEAGLLEVVVHNIRDYATGRHRITDEPPYGGGGGMVLKPEPIFAAVESISVSLTNMDGDASIIKRAITRPVILLTPQGRPFTQNIAAEIASQEQIILICGRYEGIDERVRQHLVSDEISIGDYVLTGGELAALVLIDAVARLVPGVLGAIEAAESDSFATGLLEGPHYTRPASFMGWSVPSVLRSGHAGNISLWRRQQALRRTWNRRPELLLTASLSEQDKWYLATLAEEFSAKWD
ncbi:MAG TPA: tRNA (guanosine(37)-N1)-methyltransferase TrmD [Patescibacteria group bacterium]|nr:tRNA (guanosine(37)-N1)-methyltransferase TrmD [Patescibacteria group bacterium]